MGFLAQRSRMCFVGGLRDYILVKDNTLLRGFIAFILTSWVIYSIIIFIGISNIYISDYNNVPVNNKDTEVILSEDTKIESVSVFSKELTNYKYNDYGNTFLKSIFPYSPKLNLLSFLFLLTGFGVGFFSILANGCPLRQHILAAQGNLDSIVYIFGFYCAVIFYDLVFSKFLFLIFNYIE